MRLFDASLFAQRTLWLALAISLLIQILGRFYPLENLWSWVLAPLALWLLVTLGWSLFGPAPLRRVARRVDLELHLKERLSSALAFSQIDPGRLNPPTLRLVELQQQDALKTARRIKPGRVFHFIWLRRHLRLAGFFSVVLVALAFIPNPMDRVLEERAAVRDELAEQVERIEEVAEELVLEESLTPEEKEALLRALEELSRQLSENPGDREQALADFARLEENFRQRLDANLDSRQAALESLAAQMAALAEAARGDEGESPSETPDLDQATQELAERLSEMDPAEQQALASSLANLAAQAAQAGEQGLAQALSAMAQAALSGDAQAVERSAQQVAQALDQANRSLDAQQAIQRALEQVQQGRRQVAQSGQQVAQNGNQGNSPGQNSGQNPGQNSGQNPGQGPGQGQNPGQGPGQSSGQGQGTSGGGSRADTLPPNRGQGQAGDPQGPGQSANPGRLDEQVYVPVESQGTTGEPVFIPGQDTGQGETEVNEGQNPLPGAGSSALVPYQQVFSQYLQAVNQAVESGAIPPELRDFIKAYFTQLEP